MVTPGLIFEEPPRLFSTAEELFYIPATCAQKLQFLHKCSWPALKKKKKIAVLMDVKSGVSCFLSDKYGEGSGTPL